MKSKTVRLSSAAITLVTDVREMYAQQIESGADKAAEALFTGDAIRGLKDAQIIEVCIRKVHDLFEQARTGANEATG